MDEENVQSEQASQAEQVSLEAEASKEGAEQALTEERVQQMVAEATAKAVAEAKDAGRRELQSQQDINRAELAKAERRARLAEGTLSATQQRYQDVDPDAAKDLELLDLRAREASRYTIEQEEAIRQQQRTAGEALRNSLYAHLKVLGIDPNDERVDWATDASDYVQGRSRFDSSVAKIIKENQQTMQDGLEKRLKDLEAKASQSNIEANSVETTTSQGVVAGSDTEFMKKFGAGELPMTKVNVERAQKIQKSY